MIKILAGLFLRLNAHQPGIHAHRRTLANVSSTTAGVDYASVISKIGKDSSYIHEDVYVCIYIYTGTHVHLSIHINYVGNLGDTILLWH